MSKVFDNVRMTLRKTIRKHSDIKHGKDVVFDEEHKPFQQFKVHTGIKLQFKSLQKVWYFSEEEVLQHCRQFTVWSNQWKCKKRT